MTDSPRQPEGWEYLVATLLLILAATFILTACSPKIIKEVEVVYRDRIIRDTALLEVPVEVEKIITLDTLSHLENSWARSDARVDGGFLHHSLESIPQVVKIPVEVHTTDTLWKEAQIVEKIVEVEKPLSWWQSFKIGSFGYLLAGVILLLLWTFRKSILKLIKI